MRCCADEGLEELVRSIEAGGRVPLEPQEGDLPQESAEEFVECVPSSSPIPAPPLGARGNG